MEPVYEYFTAQFGLGVVVAVICVIALVYATWLVATKYTKFKEKTDNVETKVDNLPCQQHADNIAKNEADMRKVEVSVGRMETRVEDIYEILKMMAGSAQSSRLTQTHSPLSLSPLGKEISEALGFEEILTQNWDKIAPIVEGEKNPYDIQMEFIARMIAAPEKYIDEASLDKIKKDAFLRGIPLIDYMRMVGIMARDRYFALHGIDVTEVDKTSPEA